MTVEQNPLEHFLSPNQKEKFQALCQLKEVTGVEDHSILQQALDASVKKGGEYDITHAVNMVIDEKNKFKKQGDCSQHQVNLAIDEATHKGSGDFLSSEKPSDLNDSVIDLTHEASGVGVAVGGDVAISSSEKEDDLQKAIALSLQDQHVGALGGQVTMEEQDISRVLEASLADNKTLCGTKRKRGIGGEIWQDPLNPHDRERPKTDWPVGLKNVGNTCWFSSVIQSLFHLPVFLQLVLEYFPSKDWTSNENISKRQKILFIQELRKLFALMIGTHRKYVDPSQALEIFKEALDNSTNKQQDVSEFSHKLIEWLEEAYKYASVSTRDPTFKDYPNPMTNLFYGRAKSEGQNDGHRFSNDTNFGQCPLQVNGFSDIHDSLEAAVTHEIESASDNSMTKSGQEETWVTRLPPVLLFELSRFHFNQQLGVTEKIHNKLNFPETIYMDRYLETNKEITRRKRDEVRGLKENRSKLHSRLQKYLNYGSGTKRVPLHDVLQYALEFVESNNAHGENLKKNEQLEVASCSPSVKTFSKVESKPGNSPIVSPKASTNLDVEMSSPASTNSVTMDSPSHSPLKASGALIASRPEAQTIKILNSGGFAETVSSVPTPRYISESELNVFQTCLRRWRHEVENDVKDLQEEVSKADRAIREIYNEPHLQKVPYKLHAVLVHEGQAASGHYWAYVMCPQRSIWLKCNDATVTETSWSELQKDSVGGHKNASAYCLFYVDHRLYSCLGKKDSLEKTDSARENHLPFQKLEDLPEDLKLFVDRDNQSFEHEIQVWDLEQVRSKKDSSSVTTSVSTSDTNYEESKGVIYTKTEDSKFFEFNHAMLALNSTINKLKQAAAMQCTSPVNNINTLEEAMKLETNRIHVLCSKGKNFLDEDTRLHHVGVYFLKNKLSWDPYVKRILLEQFSIPTLVTALAEHGLGKEFRQIALAQLKSLNMTEQQLTEYSEWHKRYSSFRRIMDLFVTGVNYYHKKKFKEALPYLFDSYNLNCKLIGSKREESRGFNQAVLAYYRRDCLLLLNEEAVNLFKTEDGQNNTDYVISLMNEFIIPAMTFLNGKENSCDNPSTTYSSNADSQASITIRDSWFSMLGYSLSDEKQEKLGVFLNKLMEVNSPDSVSNNGSQEIHLRPSVRLRNDDTQLEKKFDETMIIIRNAGVLEEELCVIVKEQETKAS